MSKNRILIIGPVWPEPTSSAAGTRMIQLIIFFISEGYEVLFASAAAKSDFSFELTGLGVKEYEIKLNDNSFNLFLNEVNPDIVLFDRFMMEEQYGWRVQQECPDALRLLDTVDLHCLRLARQQSIKTGHPVDLFTDTAKREIASILRCDISLLISEVEMNILQEQFHVDPSLIYYLPFLEEELTDKDIQKWKTFEEREGFVFIGNYLHEPNWNTLQILKTKIWPVLRKKLPTAKMNIYGAYSSQKVMQLHNEKEKFYVHGRADNALEVIANNRILLAPIQFGAGMKGKFIDAMIVGTPSVTTSIGAEAMKGELDWNGIIEDDAELFIDQAVRLYQDKTLWLAAQKNGVRIINERYGKIQFTKALITTISTLNLSAHRQHNFFGQILMHHTTNSTKYMSLWIAEKNAKN
ncbi:glycosyltransferase involved in cell wall biosynthesis [Pedobacter cryoconitis]|uniref:glycosyltransferase n=1 Tax=Pedobacter cryoconitis TaxID=188932 RepID=UPI0016202C88|nr:glycosyltransferase [Pedobacter cryoconitis]MBB6272413.1 glycosyltransferase involved in cell wall biosynthesis [Pedobacter cryoconitis]